MTNESNSVKNSFFFNEQSSEKIIQDLDIFRKKVFPAYEQDPENMPPPSFPSVCLVGLGRCGSNIALEVATLVYKAKNEFIHDISGENSSGKKEYDGGGLTWLKNRFGFPGNHPRNPIFLVEPVVLLGDLDKDIVGRIKYSSRLENSEFLSDYTKLSILDFSEVHAGGAGNAPILGQYLAKTILNRSVEQFEDQSWRASHSFLIDSCGIKANESRLYFYIFSAGGGTGSGMAAEFGLSQQNAYMKKTLDTSIPENSASRQSFVFEPIFSCGISILPNIASNKQDVSEALHINAGRLLCKYLSEEWNFSFSSEVESVQDISKYIRPWNSMMLISNDIMRYAIESNSLEDDSIDVNSMEKHANQYISQQIFNILTAQAVTEDYDENYFRQAGIDIGETIRLDANDLYMSLAGPVAVAYAESVSPRGEGPQSVDIDDLFFRSIGLPHFSATTQAIEGVSMLPVASERYKKILDDYKASRYDGSKLSELHFFNRCSSTVTIISLPKDFKLMYSDLNRLKVHLNNLFPHTTLKRYALVIGTSENISLTTIIAKSPCLSDEFLTLFVSYIKRCFTKPDYRFTDELDTEILRSIKDDHYDLNKLEKYIESHENPAKILDTNWFAIKPMYEKKYRELINDEEKFVSINDIRLSIDQVKKALSYLREVYRHKIGKMKVLSLSQKTPSL